MIEPAVVVRCRHLAASATFQRVVLALIVANAILVGIETDADVARDHHALLTGLDIAVVTLFVLELLVRLIGHGRDVRAFFRSGWNLFDLLVVVLSLVPAVGPMATVARLARVLRVTRLLSASPRLRLMVATMLHSIPSLGHVGLLLGILLYVYAVAGVSLFGAADPAHWGTLGRALLTLFQVITLEGWVELQREAMQATPWAWVYFASFVLIAVFVVVNLFIAVVLNNLEETRRAEAGPVPTVQDVLDEVAALRAELRARDASSARAPARTESPGAR